MERYKCRFCFKNFINGKALGGHIKSHMLSLSPKRELYEEEEEERPSQLSDDDNTESDASSSSGDRERSLLQMVDDELEFDFAEEDVESETESSRINSTRRRSKRTRKLGSFDFDFKKLKTRQPGESVTTEPEHHSSASDTTTEEDLAFCLIMLSRDKWKQQKKKKATKQSIEEDDERDHECEDYKSSKKRGRFKCETCGKMFKSYQALGGHRASHKKNKTCTTKTEQVKTEYEHGVTEKKKIHECPICFKVFSSGQALGGHKRSHGRGGGGLSSVNQIVRIDKEEEEVLVKQRMIDLNLPAPTEEDETSLVFDYER